MTAAPQYEAAVGADAKSACPPQSGVSHDDPVLEVTGVPAAEIRRRCAARRSGDGAAVTPWYPTPVAAASDARAWRLVDFGDISDADFVRAAHVVLLGRRPSDAEATRRVGELRSGSSRFQILVRLTLSPEGRAARPRVDGIGLPALVAAARGVERLANTRAGAGVVRRLESTARRAYAERSGSAARGRRALGATVTAGAAAAVARALGRLRRRSRGCAP